MFFLNIFTSKFFKTIFIPSKLWSILILIVFNPYCNNSLNQKQVCLQIPKTVTGFLPYSKFYTSWFKLNVSQLCIPQILDGRKNRLFDQNTTGRGKKKNENMMSGCSFRTMQEKMYRERERREFLCPTVFMNPYLFSIKSRLLWRTFNIIHKGKQIILLLRSKTNDFS